jgi:tRNA pseudouridine38-40 synthase
MNESRWKCVCAYDGGAFSGWQSQANGNAVQDVIETRLNAIFGHQIRVHGSGRTDAGVHAFAQVFHFDATWPHGAEKLAAALRFGLSRALQIISVRPTGPQFHARFSAVGKCYEYRIHLGDASPFQRPYCWSLYRPLDVQAMQSVAAVLQGQHDFRAFTVLNGPARENTVRNLTRMQVARSGRRVRIIAEANGFLYKMVRSLVGVLVAVGESRLGEERVRALLQSAVRTPEVQTAPPEGLFLKKVFYARARSAKASTITAAARPGGSEPGADLDAIAEDAADE